MTGLGARAHNPELRLLVCGKRRGGLAARRPKVAGHIDETFRKRKHTTPIKKSEVEISREVLVWAKAKPNGSVLKYDDFIDHIMLTYPGTKYPKADRIFKEGVVWTLLTSWLSIPALHMASTASSETSSLL